jgi:hypothetical protein
MLDMVYMYCRASRFWIFNLLQLNLDRQKNSKTKIEKAFFFIFMPSYAEMSFLGPQKLKRH